MNRILGLFRRPQTPSMEPPLEPAEIRGEARKPSEGGLDVLWFPDGQTAETLHASVVDESAHGMGFAVGQPVPIGALVWLIESPSEATKAVVRHCERSDADLWRIGVRLVCQERRRTDRDTVHGNAELKWLGPNSCSLSLPVTVLDLSDSGAGLLATVAPPIGQSVQLIGAEFECFAVIRHCCETADGKFRIGLLFARPPHNRIREVSAGWID